MTDPRAANRYCARENTSGYPNSMPGGAAPAGATCDRPSEKSKTGNATANPAIGPATPISKSTAREGKGEQMRMNAPMVPKSVGKGIKNGGVAATRYRKQNR